MKNPEIENLKIKIFPIREIPSPKLKPLIRNLKIPNPKFEISIQKSIKF